MNEDKALGIIAKEFFDALFRQVKDAIFYFSKKKRTKQNLKDKIGLIFAISTHNEDERERLQADLIKPLKQELAQSSIGELFNVLEATKEDAESIDTPQKALDYLARKRAHMIIYGELVLRNNVEGEQHHVFRLHGVVRHASIPKDISGRFGVHFREVLPELSGFPQKNEIGSFEVKRKEIAYVITYVIGVAAALSLDFSLSRKLFEDTLTRLTRIQDVDTIQPFAMFYRLTRRRLAEVLSTDLKIAYAKFVKSRDRNEILKTGKELEMLKELDPDNYPAHLSRAIFLFFSGHIEEAITEMECIHNSDVTWRYSLGFLYAYSGRIDAALEQYKQANRHPLTDTAILFDIETFISEVIEKEPSKAQLLFFRGLINHKQKGDKQLAKEDFENFIAKNNSQFLQLETLAKKYLSGISTT